MAKGSVFERQICKELSEWWSSGMRDDLFWRSSNSGGRATVRGRKGKKTAGHCGDITATDKRAAPLMKLLTMELKRGYAKNTLTDLLDRGLWSAQQQWESWIQQASEAAERSESHSWMIIARRDRRHEICVMPDNQIWNDILNTSTAMESEMSRLLRITTYVRFLPDRKSKKPRPKKLPAKKMRLVAFRWSWWKEHIDPQTIRQVLQGMKA